MCIRDGLVRKVATVGYDEMIGSRRKIFPPQGTLFVAGVLGCHNRRLSFCTCINDVQRKALTFRFSHLFWGSVFSPKAF